MGRNLNQSSMLIAGMLAVAMTGLPSAMPCTRLPEVEREVDPIREAQLKELAAINELEIMEKARLKRERKAKNKLKK
jgi:hypothetical protein